MAKYFEKNALGNKAERKKAMKETMREEFEKLKRKICVGKNSALDAQMDELNSAVDCMIHKSTVESILEVTGKYDDIIEQQSKGASQETLLHLYEKSYEGFKTNAFTLFARVLQAQAQEKSLLEEQKKYYQSELNRQQQEHSLKIARADQEERELKQRIAELQSKATEAEAQLRSARQDLMNSKRG